MRRSRCPRPCQFPAALAAARTAQSPHPPGFNEASSERCFRELSILELPVKLPQAATSKLATGKCEGEATNAAAAQAASSGEIPVQAQRQYVQPAAQGHELRLERRAGYGAAAYLGAKFGQEGPGPAGGTARTRPAQLPLFWISDPVLHNPKAFEDDTSRPGGPLVRRIPRRASSCG